MAVVRRDDHRVWIGGPLPRGAAAFTVGRTIIVRPGLEESRYVMLREAVHVRQWRRLHGVRFVARYLGSYVVWRVRGKGHLGAHRRIPLEVEAEWVARRSVVTAVSEPLAVLGREGTPR